VAVIAPNAPALYETYFGVPMAGAAVNCVNIRLNAETVVFLLGHSKSEAVMVDQEFFTLVEEALKIWAGHENNFKPSLLAVIGDKSCDPKSLTFALGRGAIEYKNFLESGDPRGRVAEHCFGLYFWNNSQPQRSVTEPPWSMSHVLE
jgi:acyl-CoA synthetase (AMP-forming)/AMP-acid ligase II